MKEYELKHKNDACDPDGKGMFFLYFVSYGDYGYSFKIEWEKDDVVMLVYANDDINAVMSKWTNL